MATIAAFYEPHSVLLAAVLAIGLFAILTYYAMSTEGDLSWYGPVTYVGIGLGFVTLILMLFFQSKIIFLICCWVGLILTCVYVVFDVYLITQKYGLEYDDYIIGAMLLYLDLI